MGEEGWAGDRWDGEGRLSGEYSYKESTKVGISLDKELEKL